MTRFTDTDRVDFVARQLMDHGGGFELYPVGPEIEYEADGNTRKKVGPWHWMGYEGETFRDALDGAMRAEAGG